MKRLGVIMFAVLAGCGTTARPAPVPTVGIVVDKAHYDATTRVDSETYDCSGYALGLDGKFKYQTKTCSRSITVPVPERWALQVFVTANDTARTFDVSSDLFNACRIGASYDEARTPVQCPG